MLLLSVGKIAPVAVIQTAPGSWNSSDSITETLYGFGPLYVASVTSISTRSHPFWPTGDSYITFSNFHLHSWSWFLYDACALCGNGLLSSLLFDDVFPARNSVHNWCWCSCVIIVGCK